MIEQVPELLTAVSAAKTALIRSRRPVTSTTVLLYLRANFTSMMSNYGYLVDPATWFKHRNRSAAEDRTEYRKTLGKRLWKRKVAIYGLPVCSVCGKKDGPAFRRQKAIHIPWRGTCSKACRCATPESKAKRAATNIKRYGVPHPSLHPEVQRKSQETMMKRHGVTHAMKSKAIQKKANRTMMKKFGVKWAMQNRDVLFQQQISSYKIKTVKIAGKVYQVQGYEPQAVKWLISKGFKVQDSRGSRYRTFPYSIQGRKRRYLPDLVASKKNRYFVEVKSPFTAGLLSRKGNDRFKDLSRKARAVSDSGSRFMLVVVSPGGKISSYRGLPTWNELKSAV